MGGHLLVMLVLCAMVCVGQGRLRFGLGRPMTNRTSEKVVVQNRSNARVDVRREAQVLVLGGGFAGVAAFAELRRQGTKDVTIIEARGSLGGRVRNFQLKDGTVLEEGANWIHGKNGPAGTNPLWKYASRANLKGHENDMESFIAYDESAADPRKPVKDSTIRWGEHERAYDCFERNKARIKKCAFGSRPSCQDWSMETIFAECGWIAESPMDMAVEWSNVDFDYGVHPARTGTGAKPNDPYGYYEFFISDPRGYASLLEEIAGKDDLENAELVRLNSRIDSIKYSDSAVTVRVTENFQGSAPKVVEYSAKHAIVTFSAGVLQRSIGLEKGKPDLVQFSPALPDWKRDALVRVNMAHYTKLFLQFDRTFWDDEEFILWAAWNRGAYPLWQNMNKAPQLRNKHMLMVTLTGDRARIASQRKINDLVDEAMRELRKFYPNAPEPKDAMVNRWSTDPFTFGSYTDIPQSAGADTVYALGYPVSRSLFFAGEATHDTFYGTVHGAYLTGKDAAKAVARCAKNKRRCPKKYRPKKK